MSKDKKEEVFYCQLYSHKFFILCAIGGAVACGSAHAFVTPLDLIKCRLQVDPKRYKSIINGFRVTYKEGGASNLVRGWAPTLIGYSLQGAAKFCGYEYFKYRYTNMTDIESAYIYRTFIYMAAAASAEFFANILLSPFEATKVRMQTAPGYTSKMRLVMPHLLSVEGFGMFYKGIVPLLGRQVPYTMIKFAAFEGTLEFLYSNIVSTPRDEMSKPEQLMVTFTAGYIAGVLCAIVSHPPDTIVSMLNKNPTYTYKGIMELLGPAGLLRGLPLRIVMVGTLTGLQWFVYDAFKVFANMPRPPPPVMPESLKKRLEEEAKIRMEQEKKRLEEELKKKLEEAAKKK